MRKMEVPGADHRERRQYQAKKSGLPGVVEVRIYCGLEFRRQFRIRDMI